MRSSRVCLGTQTLEYWIEETLRVNYETLLDLQNQANDLRTDLVPEDLVRNCNVLNSSPEATENHTILYKALSSMSSLFLEDGTLECFDSSLSPRQRSQWAE